jgi:hypothetical protein
LYLGTGITTFFLWPRFSCSFLFGPILHLIFQKSIVPWYRFEEKKREKGFNGSFPVKGRGREYRDGAFSG